MSTTGVGVFGGLLALWLGVLSTIMFRRNGKITQTVNNVDVLLPVGVALMIWLWIFAMVVFSS